MSLDWRPPPCPTCGSWSLPVGECQDDWHAPPDHPNPAEYIATLRAAFINAPARRERRLQLCAEAAELGLVVGVNDLPLVEFEKVIAAAAKASHG